MIRMSMSEKVEMRSLAGVRVGAGGVTIERVYADVGELFYCEESSSASTQEKEDAGRKDEDLR